MPCEEKPTDSDPKHDGRGHTPEHVGNLMHPNQCRPRGTRYERNLRINSHCPCPCATIVGGWPASPVCNPRGCCVRYCSSACNSNDATPLPRRPIHVHSVRGHPSKHARGLPTQPWPGIAYPHVFLAWNCLPRWCEHAHFHLKTNVGVKQTSWIWPRIAYPT